MNQTNTRDRDVEPTAAVEPAQRKSRNAISSNEQINKAEKAKTQGNRQAVRIQNRNANSSTSAQPAATTAHPAPATPQQQPQQAPPAKPVVAQPQNQGGLDEDFQ